MNQEIRNKLRNVVTKCRTLLETDTRDSLEGRFRIYERNGEVVADPNAPMTHLEDPKEREARTEILDHFGHIKARGFKPKDALDQLVREIAFTHLNRLCAYKMMEAREVYVGGQKFREAVSRGINSNGVKFYLADHPDEERLFNTGHQDLAYRHFLDWLGGLLSEEIGILFNPNDPANRLYPRQKTLDEVLDLLNDGGIKPEETELKEEWPKIWSQDETIGWVYQYFTPKELRDQARKESAAPRNSYELAFRNQFFTPRYVVEFLTDNTLGRIWYEMRKENTKLKDDCQYMVRRPNEVFLNDGEQPPKDSAEGQNNLSQEELLKLPLHIPHRPKKDPRDLKVLDPASGSGHFLLYCFDLLQTIYEEAYTDPDLNPRLKKDYKEMEDLKRDVPRLILAHNLHGIDIDLRASQIAALALWLRSQRAYQEMGLKKDRPKINRSNLVCAEPMPGEEQMLKEFVGQLEPRLLGQVVEVVFDKMKLAGEAGSLLKIEVEIRDAVAAAKKQWVRETTQATDRKGQPLLFTQMAMDRLADKPAQPSLFDLTDITDDEFFETAESNVIQALQNYAEKAQNGKRLQRRLFTDDAERGFAFLDLCHKRYDVLLMNPPFGESSKPAKAAIKRQYPLTYNDLYAAFVERGIELLTDGGALGAITSRTGFFLSSFQEWREDILLKRGTPTVVADLGPGVLDTAMVETAAYCFSLGQGDYAASFIRLLHLTDKAARLTDVLQQASKGVAPREIFTVVPQEFSGVPGSPFAYWVSKELRKAFNDLPSFGRGERTARVTNPTTDDFRFARTWWEPIPDENRWKPWVKGGELAPWYLDVDLVIDWDDTIPTYRGYPGTIYRPDLRPANLTYFFRPGLTYPLRARSFRPRVLPAGSIFSVRGYAIFAPEDELNYTLGILNSIPFDFFFKVMLGRFYYPEFIVGMIRHVPYPEPKPEQRSAVTSIATESVALKYQIDTFNETSHAFVRPWCVRRTPPCSIALATHEWDEFRGATVASLQDLERRLNDIAFEIYGMSDQQKKEVLSHLTTATEEEQDDADERNANENSGSDAKDAKALASSLVSWCVGVAFGRWNIEKAFETAESLVSAFSPLHLYSPALVNGDVRSDAHAAVARSGGILLDDAESDTDIIRHIRRVLEFVWKSNAAQIEKEICHVLGVKELREYFRKAGKGGFWDDHVNRYSKSGRQAPIYWLLQSSDRNFALWVYSPKIDRDLLFKALLNFVEPKIRLEESRIHSLRPEASAPGADREARRLAMKIETQEDLLSELKDFEDKLRRAANLYLDFDLNDGIVLNIAPLHELVPWKVARRYWEDLVVGKYDWSSISKQLRQKGLVK